MSENEKRTKTLDLTEIPKQPVMLIEKRKQPVMLIEKRRGIPGLAWISTTGGEKVPVNIPDVILALISVMEETSREFSEEKRGES